jgi:hypothetical protein
MKHPQPPPTPPIPSVVVFPIPVGAVGIARQVARKSRPARLAEQLRTLLSEQRRSVTLSPARPPDPAGPIAVDNLGAEP